MLRKSLKSLPQTLDETYERILCSIRPEDVDYAVRILRWLAFSTRPLTLKEVSEAVAIDIERDPPFDKHEVFQDPLDILEVCQSLVTITEGLDNNIYEGRISDSWFRHYYAQKEFKESDDSDMDDHDTDDADADQDENKSIKRKNNPTMRHTQRTISVFQLTHYSVKEYLTSDRIHNSQVRRYSIQQTTCNYFIAQSCIAYISQLNLACPVSRAVEVKFPLAGYASMSWIKHLQAARETAEPLNQRIIRLFLLGIFTYTYGAYDTIASEERVPSPLHFASILGLTTVAKCLLDSGADANLNMTYFGTPLHAAAFGGHKATAQLLLESGADVNAYGSKYGSPLLAAVAGRVSGKTREANLEVKRLLWSRETHTILYEAECAADDSMVKLLCDAGANANAVTPDGTTSLAWAIMKRRENTVKMLITAGADVHAPCSINLMFLLSNKRDRRPTHVGREAFPLVSAYADNARPAVLLTALHLAIIGCQENLITLLLSAGSNVNASSGVYASALEVAADKGNRDIFLLILNAGADINVNCGPRGTLLHVAARSGSLPIVNLLLDRGLNTNEWSEWYGSVLRAAALHEKDESSVHGDNVVTRLLESGADLNPQDADANGHQYASILHEAVHRQNKSYVEPLLRAGADVNAYHKTAGYVLHEAIKPRPQNSGVAGENTENIDLLIKAGADVNAHHSKHGSVLHAAVSEYANHKIVKRLLEAGADANACCCKKHGSVLHAAVSRGPNRKTIGLLLEAGADVNARSELYGSVLHMTVLRCSTHGFYETLPLLLAAGADVNAKCKRHGSVLCAAVLSERGYKIIRLLLDAGADTNAKLEIFGSVLHIAVLRCYSYNVVDLLLKAGADVNAKSERFGSVFGAATSARPSRRNKRIIELLLTAGAHVDADAEGNAMRMRDGDKGSGEDEEEEEDIFGTMFSDADTSFPG